MARTTTPKTSPTPFPSPLPPVTTLSLFRSGVGYVTRSGPTSGPFTIPMPAESVNDVLASVSTRGPIRGVTFATQAGENRELARRGLPEEPKDILINLCTTKLRGQEVVINGEVGSTLLEKGIVLGVDITESLSLNGTTIQVYRVVIRSAEGSIQRHDFTDIREMTPTDPALQKDLDFWTQSMRTQRGVRGLSVQVNEGGGVIEMGYLVPAPIWRTNYDLALPADGTDAVLTPRAIVYNPLDEELVGVRLQLTTGKPVSFRANLDSPVSPTRHVLTEDLSVEAPVQYAATMSSRSNRARATKGGSSRGLESFVSNQDDDDAPIAASMSLSSMESGYRAEESATQAEVSTGEETEFEISDVSMPPGGAISLALTRKTCPASLVRVWRLGQPGKNPEQAVRLTNGDMVLEQGPVALTIGGKFVGQAVMPFSPPGKEILLPFTKDRKVTVDSSQGTAEMTITRVGTYDKNRKDIIVSDARVVTPRVFQIHSLHDRTVGLVIEMSRSSDETIEAALGGPYQIESSTPTATRIFVLVDPGTTTITVPVVSQRPTNILIRNLRDETFRSWPMREDQRTALEDALVVRESLATAEVRYNKIRSAIFAKEAAEKEVIAKLKDLGLAAPTAAVRFQEDLNVIGRAIDTLRTQETTAEADLEQKKATWEAALDGLYAVLSK